MAMDELLPTRASLLHRLKNLQDQASWEDFFNLYAKLIFDLALKAGLDRSEAEEVLQETMIAVARHMPTFKYDPSVGSFKAWLFNMARWRITDQFRKRRSTADLPEETGTGTRAMDRVPDTSLKSLDAVWEAEWEQQLLSAALSNVKRRLDPQKFQIFDLYVNKGWPPEKVAAMFDVSVDQVYLAKHRITELLRAEVARLEKEIV